MGSSSNPNQSAKSDFDDVKYCLRELQCTLQDGLPSVASGKEMEQVARSEALKLSGQHMRYLYYVWVEQC